MKSLCFAALSLLLFFPVNGFSQESGMSEQVNTSQAVRGGDRPYEKTYATRSPVLAKNGMIASSHPLASQVGIDILKAGGNALDAAIAANAAIGLMEPTGNGIGGDLFLILWDPKTEKVYGLNGSGRAPLGQTLDQLKAKVKEDVLPLMGVHTLTVPGTVDAWYTAHDRFGSLPMPELLKPAIDYAKEGFPLTKIIAAELADNMTFYQVMSKRGSPEEIDNLKSLYTVNGKAPAEGEIFKNPDLASSLQKISDEGREAFYSGDIAKTIVSYVQNLGSALSLDDFEQHQSTWVEPVSVNYRGYDVYELPPNGQGIAALQMLNMLEDYDLRSMGHNSPEALHVMIEAKKLAYEDRAKFFADPEFFDVPLTELLSKGYADKRRSLIGEGALEDIQSGDPILQKGDTIYLTTADKDGMMVSLIQSNYWELGSGLVPDGLGFVLQNRGRSFSLDPNHANAYEPGKRPFHTIIPAFVTKDGEPVLSFGLMGGDMQPQGHVQIIANLIDFGMNVQQAGDAARFYHTGSTSPWGDKSGDHELHLESGVPDAVKKALIQKGHNMGAPMQYSPFGGYQAIWRDPESGVYHGASEMRKDGQAIGY